MALWNAPRRLKHHERAAVGAALDMQVRMVELHKQWATIGLPAIRCAAIRAHTCTGLGLS